MKPQTNPSLQEGAQSMRAILTFFAFVFAWSWGGYFAAVQAKPYSKLLETVLLISANFGPTLAGFAVVALFSTRSGLRNWLARCMNWHIGWHWWALVFLVPPVLMMSVRAVQSAFGGPVSALPSGIEILLVLANFGFGLLVGGPLGEEFGWRGYAMNALTARLKWPVAALIVGVIWGLWHVPLFFMVGTVQSHMQMAPFMVSIVSSSMVFGWLFEHTKRSVLPALILHTSVNAWIAILAIPVSTIIKPYAIVATIFVTVASVLLVRGGDAMGRWKLHE
jgi:uncharacterized protein